MKLDVDGRSAFAYTGGQPFDAALPCVVLVHGAMNDHSVFTLLARWLAHHGHAVLAVDLPGHGRSAGPPLADIEAHADWLLALLTAAGVERAALVGHSMGSLIALEAAARAPRRATHLVLIGSVYPMKVSAALLDSARETPLAAIDRVNALSISSTASKPGFPGPGAWVHGGNRALMRRQQAQAQRESGLNLFAHDFGLCDRYAHGLEAAAAVTCPSTLIVGASDQMTMPKHSGALAEALRARRITLAGGHALMSEVPDALLDALRQALA